jgi:CHAD domain-containing protein
MTPTTAELVAAYWSRQQTAMTRGVLAVGAGELAAVHPSRVAVRRLRSTLRTFGDLLDPGLTGGLDPQLRQLAGELGEVRDHEVLRNLLAAWPEADPAAKARVTSRLDDEIAAGLSQLAVVAASTRVAELLNQVTTLGAAVPKDGDGALLRARSSHLVARRFRRAEAVEPDPVRLHAVRKAVKRARYAAEVFPDDESARRDVLRFELLQEVLGRHQDLAMAGDYLRSAANVDPALRTPAIAVWVADLDASAAAAAREVFSVAESTGTFPVVVAIEETA